MKQYRSRPIIKSRELPLELTTKIAQHIEFYEDFEAFGQVCTQWRCAMKLADRSAATHQTPWLMLQDFTLMSKSRLYSIYNHKVKHLDLLTHDTVHGGKLQYVLCSRGWIVCVPYLGGSRDVLITLMHPLSGEVIRTAVLPKNLLEKLYPLYQLLGLKLRYAFYALSDSPSTTSNYTLAITSDHSDVIAIVSWNSINEEWKVLEFRKDDYNFGLIIAITFYKGELYICDYNCTMIVATLASASGQDIRCLSLGIPINIFTVNVYLVESAGALLLVICEILRDTPNYRVLEVNSNNGETKEVKTLGNRALFLNTNCSFSFSVEASPHGCKPNCIYCIPFHGDKSKDVQFHVYDLTSNQVTRFHIAPSQLKHILYVRRPMWIEAPSCFPSLH